MVLNITVHRSAYLQKLAVLGAPLHPAVSSPPGWHRKKTEGSDTTRDMSQAVMVTFAMRTLHVVWRDEPLQCEVCVCCQLLV